MIDQLVMSLVGVLQSMRELLLWVHRMVMTREKKTVDQSMFILDISVPSVSLDDDQIINDKLCEFIHEAFLYRYSIKYS